MKLLLGISGSGVLLGGLYAGGALSDGRVYNVPYATAHAELSTMELPDGLARLLGGAGGAELVVEPGSDTIGWRLRVAGKEAGRFTARLSREGVARTRVRIRYTRGTSNVPYLDQLQSTALMRDFSEIAMREQIEARLEHRRPDDRSAMQAMGEHLAAHPEQLDAYGAAVRNTFTSIADEIAINSKPTGLPATDTRKMMDDAARPSVVLPTN